MDDESWLELMDTYQDIVEKQDEIICRLGKIVARQATDLQLMRNDKEFSNPKLEEDMAAANEVIGRYKDIKSELEP